MSYCIVRVSSINDSCDVCYFLLCLLFLVCYLLPYALGQFVKIVRGPTPLIFTYTVAQKHRNKYTSVYLIDIRLSIKPADMHF